MQPQSFRNGLSDCPERDPAFPNQTYRTAESRRHQKCAVIMKSCSYDLSSVDACLLFLDFNDGFLSFSFRKRGIEVVQVSEANIHSLIVSVLTSSKFLKH